MQQLSCQQHTRKGCCCCCWRQQVQIDATATQGKENASLVHTGFTWLLSSCRCLLASVAWRSSAITAASCSERRTRSSCTQASTAAWTRGAGMHSGPHSCTRTRSTNAAPTAAAICAQLQPWERRGVLSASPAAMPAMCQYNTLAAAPTRRTGQRKTCRIIVVSSQLLPAACITLSLLCRLTRSSLPISACFSWLSAACRSASMSLRSL